MLTRVAKWLIFHFINYETCSLIPTILSLPLLPPLLFVSTPIYVIPSGLRSFPPPFSATVFDHVFSSSLRGRRSFMSLSFVPPRWLLCLCLCPYFCGCESSIVPLDFLLQFSEAPFQTCERVPHCFLLVSLCWVSTPIERHWFESQSLYFLS